LIIVSFNNADDPFDKSKRRRQKTCPSVRQAMLSKKPLCFIMISLRNKRLTCTYPAGKQLMIHGAGAFLIARALIESPVQ
jgi:hypothetical protein